MGAPILISSEDGLQCPLRQDASSIGLQKNPKPNRKKRTPKAINTSSQKRDSSVSVVKHPGVNLLMGQVKILKRGEKLSPDNNTTMKSHDGCESDSEELGSTKRIGPEPETVQKQVRVSDLTGEVYSGPSMASPPPNSVPVPRFLVSLMIDLDD